MSYVSEINHRVPKEILLIVRWPGGGIRTFIRYVYHKIDVSKWHLTILAPESGGMDLLRNDLAETNTNFIPVTGIPTDGSSGAVIFTKQIIKTLRSRKFDLVHSHGFISGTCAALPVFFCRFPHILTSHDVINKEQFFGFKGKIKKIALCVALRLVNRVHSVSKEAQENLFENFPHVDDNYKSIVISNGIEIDRFREATPRDLNAEKGLGENVFFNWFSRSFYGAERISILG